MSIETTFDIHFRINQRIKELEEAIDLLEDQDFKDEEDQEALIRIIRALSEKVTKFKEMKRKEDF
jgi:hypothetical protein